MIYVDERELLSVAVGDDGVGGQGGARRAEVGLDLYLARNLAHLFAGDKRHGNHVGGFGLLVGRAIELERRSVALDREDTERLFAVDDKLLFDLVAGA